MSLVDGTVNRNTHATYNELKKALQTKEGSLSTKIREDHMEEEGLSEID